VPPPQSQPAIVPAPPASSGSGPAPVIVPAGSVK
jgi:hypothetical protein